MAIKSNRFYELFEKCIDDGIAVALDNYARLKEKKVDSLYLPKHDDYPSINYYQSSGLPHFSIHPAYLGYKVSYAKILSECAKENKIPSWERLENQITESGDVDNFFKYTDLDQSFDQRFALVKLYVFSDLEDIIDSIIHRCKDPRRKSRLKSKLISEYFKSLSRDKLEYDIVVPIILYQPIQSFTITDSIKIVKMSEQFQLSRNFRLPENIVANKSVISAATHAFEIKGRIRRIENSNKWLKYEQIKSRIERSYELIDRLFVNLRISIKQPVGYCQVIARPVGFTSNFTGGLLDLSVFGNKNFPQNYIRQDLYEFKYVSKKQLYYFKKIINKKVDKNLNFAMNKLLESDSRVKEEDGIIDISTALEALLSDSTDNLKYKISLRSAAVCKAFKFYQFSPVQIKKIVGGFYDLRSAIVHGASPGKIQNKKVLSLADGVEINAYAFCKLVLIHVIEVFILHPEWNDTAFIDNSLL